MVKIYIKHVFNIESLQTQFSRTPARFRTGVCKIQLMGCIQPTSWSHLTHWPPLRPGWALQCINSSSALSICSFLPNSFLICVGFLVLYFQWLSCEFQLHFPITTTPNPSPFRSLTLLLSFYSSSVQQWKWKQLLFISWLVPLASLTEFYLLHPS